MSHVERTVAVIVVAAGAGVRLGHDLPKAFVSLAGSTLLERAVATLGLLAEPVQVVVVAPAGSEGSALDIAQRAVDTSRSPVTVVTGGATRHESVVAGLAALEPGVTTVLVHDSARCLTPVDVFDRVIADVRRTGHGVVPGVRVSEVVRDLYRRDKDRGLSAGEKRMLAKARQILESELALAEKTDGVRAAEILDEVLAS